MRSGCTICEETFATDLWDTLPLVAQDWPSVLKPTLYGQSYRRIHEPAIGVEVLVLKCSEARRMNGVSLNV
ncbi:MAG: hypothetical protein M3Y27_22340, partial [Acidobacteriota bacterium]|nr:hypothetical protein [Acidobacteriota bacterium]